MKTTSAHKENCMKIKSAVQSIALTLALLVSLNVAALAQRNSDEKSAAPASDTTNTAAKTDAKTDTSTAPKPASVEDRLRALEQLVLDQQREIQSLHTIIDKSNAATAQPAANMPPVTAGATTAQPEVAGNQTPASGKNETPDQAQSQKRVEDL